MSPDFTVPIGKAKVEREGEGVGHQRVCTNVNVQCFLHECVVIDFNC